MTTWHYYSKKGEKVGPITTMTLKALAERGLITPETVIENSNGRSAIAGKVNGLTFPVLQKPPERPEVYGLSTPSLKASGETNPFTATPAIAENPFTDTPAPANPFTVSTLSNNIKTPQKIPVPEKTQNSHKPIVIAGIAGIIVFLLLFTALSSFKNGGNVKNDHVPAMALPDASKSPRDGSKTQLDQLRKERDEARRQRIEAEDWLREYDVFKKEEEASKKATEAQATYVATGRRIGKFSASRNSPLWRTINPDGMAKIMRDQKLRAERKLEELEDRIRDIQNN